MITADVGVKRFTNPDAHWNAVTVIERATPAKSESGARIGITSAACPDDDGTRNAIGMLTRNARIANTPVDVPETFCSIQLRMVSGMYELRMTTVIRRASTMLNAAPGKADPPPMIVATVLSSAKRPMTHIMTAISMKR